MKKTITLLSIFLIAFFFTACDPGGPAPINLPETTGDITQELYDEVNAAFTEITWAYKETVSNILNGVVYIYDAKNSLIASVVGEYFADTETNVGTITLNRGGSVLKEGDVIVISRIDLDTLIDITSVEGTITVNNVAITEEQMQDLQTILSQIAKFDINCTEVVTYKNVEIGEELLSVVAVTRMDYIRLNYSEKMIGSEYVSYAILDGKNINTFTYICDYDISAQDGTITKEIEIRSTEAEKTGIFNVPSTIVY